MLIALLTFLFLSTSEMAESMLVKVEHYVNTHETSEKRTLLNGYTANIRKTFDTYSHLVDQTVDLLADPDMHPDDAKKLLAEYNKAQDIAITSVYEETKKIKNAMGSEAWKAAMKSDSMKLSL